MSAIGTKQTSVCVVTMSALEIRRGPLRPLRAARMSDWTFHQALSSLYQPWRLSSSYSLNVGAPLEGLAFDRATIDAGQSCSWLHNSRPSYAS